MIIIDKDDLGKYRYAVAKVAFLKTYSDFSLVKNNQDDNSMLVLDTKTSKEKLLYFFRKPKTLNIKNYQIAYQKYVRKSKNQKTNSENTFILSRDFEECYKKDLYMALVSASMYYRQLENKYKLFFEKYLVDIVSAKDTFGNLCKYYNDEKISKNKHNINDGNISFINPKLFNDPFDCNCSFSSGEDMSDYFRILCLTPEYKNILMWSYYANEHKGYCFEYSKHSIIEQICGLDINGLCIIGKVYYKNKRPATRSSLDKLSYSELIFYINASFTKYDKWSHEKEYRFVLLSEDLLSKEDHIDISVKIEMIYSGCRCSKPEVLDSSSNLLPITELKKDDTGYLLEEK